MDYSYHAFITDRTGALLEVEADHRRHAEVEATIRDLKYGVGLNHLPSGRFGANGAWLACNVMAHNLIRWAGVIGLGPKAPSPPRPSADAWWPCPAGWRDQGAPRRCIYRRAGPGRPSSPAPWQRSGRCASPPERLRRTDNPI